MSAHILERCKAITHELMDRPLNGYFREPVDPIKEGLKNYNEIVEHPMDFSTIDKRLKSDYYPSGREWYNDVCLVYENALKYHPKGTIFHQIAEYSLNEFKKQAVGFGCTEPQQWYDLVAKGMRELSEEIANGPVPQGVDPMILSIIKKAEGMVSLNPRYIAEVVDKLNRKLDNDDVRHDVMCILNETEPQLKIDGESMTIDADALSQQSLNTLYLYVKSQNRREVAVTNGENPASSA